VAFRESGEGGVWRCSAGEPEPGSPALLRHPEWSPARATCGARAGAHGGVHAAHGRRDVS
jgi:hypothetical protein